MYIYHQMLVCFYREADKVKKNRNKQNYYPYTSIPHFRDALSHFLPLFGFLWNMKAFRLLSTFITRAFLNLSRLPTSYWRIDILHIRLPFPARSPSESDNWWIIDRLPKSVGVLMEKWLERSEFIGSFKGSWIEPRRNETFLVILNGDV